MVSSAWLEPVSQDLRFALRSFRRNPLFAAVAVLTLALGIGVDTAMFSVLDAVLLRELPYADPGRLVTLRQMFPKIGELALGTSPAEYLDYRDRTSSFASVAGYEAVAMDLTGEGEPVRVQAQRVTDALFSAWPRLMSGLLFGIRAFDVATFAGAAALLLAAAALASFVPARRASRLDPMNALRSE